MDTTMILDSGNTAWIIVATLLVLLMTIPGIALFYGGLVRQKNVLSIIMQSLLIVGAVSILWVAFGYSFVFGSSLMETDSVWRHFIGGFDKLFLQGITTSSLTTGRIPELMFVLFQCMFAVITPALILGAFAERVKFDLFPLGQGRYRPDDEGCSVQSPEHIEYQLQKLQGGSVVYGYKGSEDDVAYDRGNRQDRRRHYSHRHIVAGEIAAEDTLEKSLPVLAERLIISS